MMRHSAAVMDHNDSYGSGGANPSTAFPLQSYRPFSAKEIRQSEATGAADGEVEAEALQRSDKGRDRFLLQVYSSVPQAGDTKHVEVGTVQHTYGGRVLDCDMAVCISQEILPSYDTISGNV